MLSRITGRVRSPHSRSNLLDHLHHPAARRLTSLLLESGVLPWGCLDVLCSPLILVSWETEMSLPLLSRDMWLARELAVVGAEPNPLIADGFFFSSSQARGWLGFVIALSFMYVCLVCRPWVFPEESSELGS